MNWTRTILDGLAVAAYFNLFLRLNPKLESLNLGSNKGRSLRSALC